MLFILKTCLELLCCFYNWDTAQVFSLSENQYTPPKQKKKKKNGPECKANHHRYRTMFECFKVKLFKIHSFRFDETSVPDWLDDICFLEAEELRGCSQVFRARYCCQCNYLQSGKLPMWLLSKHNRHTLIALWTFLDMICGRRWALMQKKEGWRSAERDLGHLEHLIKCKLMSE